MKLKAFKAAFPYTIPVLIGFLCMGMSYGFLMSSVGFSVFCATTMSFLILAGAIQFVGVNILLSTFDPFSTFIVTLLVNARYLFYGISVLERYKNTGWIKPYLIFGMCDESFSINSTVPTPDHINRQWFMFFVTFLNHFYWVLGTFLGAVLGSFIKIDTKGIEFVMTALFVVMFVEQWLSTKNHAPALIGVFCSLLCLLFFGSEYFMIPTMSAIIICFTLARYHVKARGIR